MSIRSSAAKKLLVMVIGLAAVVAALVIFLNSSPEVQLRLARAEVEQLLTAANPATRKRHAEECIRVAAPLIDGDGVTGNTAALYVIAVAPVAGQDVEHIVVPDEAAVEAMATEDLLNISRLFFNTRRFGPSDQLIDLILGRNDQYREAGLRLAVTVRFDLGRDEDVVAHCSELIKLHPGDANAYRVMALVHRNHGRWEHFVDAAENAVKFAASVDPEQLIDLIDGYVHLGRTSDARRELDRVMQDRPDLVLRAPIMHARLLLQEGETAKADQILSAFLKRDPNDAEALILKGTMLIATQQFADAVSVLENAIAQSPAEEQAYYQLGQALARLGRQDDAGKALNRHRELLDTKVRLHELEQLAAREPDNVSVRVELAHTYAEIGLTEQADFWTRAVLAAQGR